MTYTVETLKEKKLIIFEAKGGSHAYGTSLPTSDVDIRGVFVQPPEDILKYGYVDQVSDEKNDIVFYELRRFFQLLSKNNPNIVELLYIPEDCVIYKHPVYKRIEKNRDQFITKQCRLTFGGYAIGQIKKARGYNKKINWEESQMTRKTVLDFCYLLINGKSVPLKEYLKEAGMSQEQYSLAKIDHAHDVYAMYHYPSGIVSDEEKANDVQLTSIPKGYYASGYLTFNKDAYSIHCKRHREYQTWLKERNEDRFKMNKDHGKNYDSKNMMHTFRLLKTALEIAENGKINVRRPAEEIDILMKIRKGEYAYDKLLSKAEEMIDQLDEAFENSSLPEKVNNVFVVDFQYEIRKQFNCMY